MKITGGIAAAAAPALLMAACAQQQAVSVIPDVRVPEAASAVGSGRAVLVSVADKRPSPAMAGDLSTIVRSAVASGLARLGFNPTPARSGVARELRIEILDLEYSVAERSALSRHVAGASRLKALCFTDGAPRLERSYRGDLSQSVLAGTQDASSHSRNLSSVVSEPINALLADADMMQCLAR